MTRIFVQRGSGSGSSSNSGRTSVPGSSSTRTEALSSSQAPLSSRDEETVEVAQEPTSADMHADCYGADVVKDKKRDDKSPQTCFSKPSKHVANAIVDAEKVSNDADISQLDIAEEFSGLKTEENCVSEFDWSNDEASPMCYDGASPSSPPVPPPQPVATNINSRRPVSNSANVVRIGSSRTACSISSARISPPHSRPSSPRSQGASEGYNSADEQNPSLVSSYNDLERDRQFEIDIRRAKGFEVKKMLEDGNCLFRAVADQVYGDSEAYDLTRQMCIDYMERERDHFSQFVTEGFSSYCKRKRRDKVYGNNVEIQALAEMYSQPIHIYSYSMEPINIFQGTYMTDLPPIRLSYHHGNHYNSLIDPRGLTIGAGLGFSSLRGRNVGKNQVKAAIKAQQDQQIDNALLAEGRFYSDLELTEKEIERMVMEASRAEYLADDKFKLQPSCKDSSTSNAEPSSSGARSSGSDPKVGGGSAPQRNSVLSSSMQMMLSMGFSYLQAAEAYSIFGDDVDSMVSYLLETGNTGGRRKGKATEWQAKS